MFVFSAFFLSVAAVLNKYFPITRQIQVNNKFLVFHKTNFPQLNLDIADTSTVQVATKDTFFRSFPPFLTFRFRAVHNN